MSVRRVNEKVSGYNNAAAFNVSKTIEEKKFDYLEDEEPELPLFLKKSPKRIQMDD